MLAGTGGDEGGTAGRGTKPHPKTHPSLAQARPKAHSSMIGTWEPIMATATLRSRSLSTAGSSRASPVCLTVTVA